MQVNALHAQAPQQRTTSTILADALAQLPASTPDRYKQVMNDLVSTGEEGLLNLIGRLNPPGNISNETIEFALSGWTNSVANDEPNRIIAANAFEKALNLPVDNVHKATFIRHLDKIGTDDNVDVLASLLNNKDLSAPASQALVSIGTENAHAELVKALQSTSDDAIVVNMVNALSQTGYTKAEPVLLDFLAKNPSEVLKSVLVTALGNIGTEASVKTLQSFSKYEYAKDDATNAYILLLNRVAAKSPKLVEKEANGLLKTATKAGKSDLKLAAADLLLSLPSTNKVSILKNAFKDGDLIYVTNVLHYYPFESDAKAMQVISKELNKSKSPAVRTAIIYWLGNKKIDSSVSQLTNALSSENAIIKKAAILSIAKIGNEGAMLALAGLLKSNDKDVVELARNGISTYNGDISYTLASIFNEAGDAGKIAALQLIANRKMESQYNLVYNQMFTENEVVKAEAAKTLQQVVTDSNLDDLFRLLEQSDEKNTASIQQAINAALSYLPADRQQQIVTEKMNQSANKYLYFSPLANSGSQTALDAITKAFSTEKGKNRQAALDALKTWKSFDVIYPLFDIARSSKDNNEINQAVDAAVQKVSTANSSGAVKYLFLRNALELSKTDQQKNRIIKLLGNTGMYQAMILVAPYMDNSALSESAAQAVMNIAVNNSTYAGEKTTELLNKASKTLNNPDAVYQRQSIQKYLTENNQDNGYKSIFNGKNLDGWKGLVENPIKRAQMSKKELEAAQKIADKKAAESWIVENGNLIFTGKGDNLCTDKMYGDFDMLIDWKLYQGPEPDAGIYLRGTPQVQIWDTARVNVGAQVGSGGLYNNKENPSKPLKVSDIKLEEWNTFRIKMTGDRVSVWLNGDLVTDNVILENYWDRKSPIFPIEQIELQAHGSKVEYRDIYIKELERTEPFKLSAEEVKDGYEVLFDGTNMHKWTGNKGDYILEDGNIALYPSRSFGGNLYTKEQYDNFVLRFEFMLTPGANNGLGIRTPLEGDAAYQGMELQILDNESPIYKNLKVYQYHGSVYGVIPSKRGFLKPVGEWNYQEVIANGDNIKVVLNGETILEGNIREASKNGTVDGREHPGLLNKTGHIGFLGHGSEVKFRNIRIKELK